MVLVRWKFGFCPAVFLAGLHLRAGGISTVKYDPKPKWAVRNSSSFGCTALSVCVWWKIPFLLLSSSYIKKHFTDIFFLFPSIVWLSHLFQHFLDCQNCLFQLIYQLEYSKLHGFGLFYLFTCTSLPGSLVASAVRGLYAWIHRYACTQHQGGREDKTVFFLLFIWNFLNEVKICRNRKYCLYFCQQQQGFWLNQVSLYMCGIDAVELTLQ